jgi:hypothetical protein
VCRVVTYFLYSLWLLCLLSSADLAACSSMNASLSWTGPSFCSVFLSLSVVYFLYYLEYRVVGVDVCDIHLQSFFTRLVYMIFLQCIQKLSSGTLQNSTSMRSAFNAC